MLVLVAPGNLHTRTTPGRAVSDNCAGSVVHSAPTRAPQLVALRVIYAAAVQQALHSIMHARSMQLLDKKRTHHLLGTTCACTRKWLSLWSGKGARSYPLLLQCAFVEQTPWQQTSPVAHLCPHAPQFLASEYLATRQPCLAGAQLRYPEAHW